MKSFIDRLDFIMAIAMKRKRSYTKIKRKTYKRRNIKKQIRQIANQVVQRNIETKTSQHNTTDGIEILHNNFVTLAGPYNLLWTQPGTVDEEQGLGTRIGDKIKVKGVGLRMMLELNERYSDVTFRILVVKCARGDVPTRDTLFNGESGNKMMDSLNKERYTIIAQKFVKITSRNMGLRDTTTQLGPILEPSGIYTSAAAAADNYLTRATRIVRMWIPGTKFGRGGFLQYQNQSDRTKFFDYYVLCYAYSNYSTAQDVFEVGRVNEFLNKMYYKDA